MRGFLAVLENEIRAHWHIFAVAIALGVVPVVLPWFSSHRAPEDLRAATATVLAGGLGTTLAIILGATALARELADRKGGFLFSMPLAGGSILAGKLFGAALLASIALGLVLLPATAVQPEMWVASTTTGVEGPAFDPSHVQAWTVVSFLAIWILVPISHALSVMGRARTAWLLLDLAVIAAATGLIARMSGRLAQEGSVVLATGALRGLGAAVLLTVIVAGFLQTTQGRVSLTRSHRWLSLALALGLGVCTLAFLAWGRWVTDVGVGDLVSVDRAQEIEDSGWLFVEGFVALTHRY